MATEKATKRVRMRVELDVDLDAYQATYGVTPDRVAGDVEDYVVDLLGYCAASAEGCWTVQVVRGLAR